MSFRSNKTKNPNLSGEHNSTTSLLNFLLGGLRHQLSLDDHRLILRQNTFSEDFKVPELCHVDHRSRILGGLGFHVLRDKRPELVDVDDGAMELVTEPVEVPHTNLTEITRMVFVEEDPVVMHASSVTATPGVLPVLPDTTVTGAHMAALLAVLLEAGCHFGSLV
ncbi:hypothetical protein CXB51_004461 [Gossypium anomalum]|uniref:Uncharacterized protein n=1 Tax=Gossypium anomalum TaxID=47600 RepID=A0A8J6DD27_9ROSI|nr:hypothetical protein CXB51_004461 [Gossypium anomalum]